MTEETETQQDDSNPTDTGNDQESTGTPTGSKTFTQDDVNRLIGETRTQARERAQQQFLTDLGVESVDALKGALKKMQELEDAGKSETEKLTGRITALENDKAALQEQGAQLAQQRVDALLRSAVVSEATRLGFLDPMDAYHMIDLAQLEVKEDDSVSGVEDVLKKLGEAKPYLLHGKLTLGPTNPARGGSTSETDAERRARLYGVGGTPIGQSGGGVYMPKIK